MKSEVKLAGQSWKITFTIGLFLTVLIIFLSVWFRAEISILLIGVAGSVVMIGLVVTFNRASQVFYAHKMRSLEAAMSIQQLRQLTYEADKLEAAKHFHAIPKGQRVVTVHGAPVKVIDAPIQPVTGVIGDDIPMAQIDLMAALDSAQRCLIVGASDSGKTTLLQHIISRRVLSSKVVVIDPHSYPHKWQACKVVGTGRNYTEIDTALISLVDLMSKRYDEIGRGIKAEGTHARLTILVDEWRAIVQNTSGAGDAIKALLTESRKAAFSVFVATHSDRAKPLGLQGEYDLKDGFAIVRLSIANGLRQATFDDGNGEVPAILPGPFQGMPLLPHGAVGDNLHTDEYINLEVQPSPTEAEVLRLHKQGVKPWKIAEQLFGKGGEQTKRVQTILAKFGVV